MKLLLDLILIVFLPFIELYDSFQFDKKNELNYNPSKYFDLIKYFDVAKYTPIHPISNLMNTTNSAEIKKQI